MISINSLPIVMMILILLYVILFVLDKVIFRGSLFRCGCQKSFDNMNRNEWYRLFTGSFFHINLIHLLGNVFAIYFIGTILENKIGSCFFLIIYLIGNIAESLISAKIFSYQGGCGASPGIYALIACMLILHLHNPNFLNLHYNDISCNYTVWYFFLANFIGLDGLISHSLGFSFGIVISMMLLLTGML